MDAFRYFSFVNSIASRAERRADSVGRFGQDAIWKLREAYANVTGRAPRRMDRRRRRTRALRRLRFRTGGLSAHEARQEKAGKLDKPSPHSTKYSPAADDRPPRRMVPPPASRSGLEAIR
jgi:hypothetical protein